MKRVLVKKLGVAAVAAAAFLVGIAAGAQPVLIELINGDRITGRIVSETTNTVVLSNSWTRELSIPVAQITRRLTNVIALAGTTNLLVTNPIALAKAVAVTNTIFSAPMFKHLHGELQAGADLTLSERNRQIYNAKSKLVYAKDRLKANVDFDTTYGRSEVSDPIITATRTNLNNTKTVTDANRMNGSIKLDYDLTDRLYVYNLGGAGYDELRKIDLRYEIGPGLGYHLIRITNFFANTEFGFNYQEERHP